jgi:hypothetical protein
MEIQIQTEHKQKLAEIYKRLNSLGSKESSFAAVESLFYEAISISRQYGNDLSDNKFLASLKEVELEEYKVTQGHFKKANQREIAIKKFMTRFKGKIQPFI